MTDAPGDAPRSTRTPAELPWRTISLFLLTGAGVVCSLLFTRVLLFATVGAVALAVVSQPLVRRLEKRLSPTLTATACVVLATLALVLPLFFLLRDLLGEAITLVRFVQNGSAEALLYRVAQAHPKVGGILLRGAQQVDFPGMLRQVAAASAGPVGMLFSKVADGVTSTVMLLFFYFFLIRDRRSAVEALRHLIPLHDAHADDLLRSTRDVVEAIFAGRFLIALVQGALAGVAYLLLGVPGPLLWGSVTVVCCLVPAFGSFVAWVPIALYLGLADSWTKAAILAAWGGIVVGNIDNVLYPALVGKKTDLHTAIIFVAIFGGLAVFGLSGFVLGPVIVSVTISLLRIWRQKIHATPE